MKSFNKLQVGIVVGAVILFVLLYFANKKSVKKAEDVVARTSTEKAANMAAFTQAKIATLNDSLKGLFQKIDKRLTTSTAQNTAAIDSMIAFWDAQKLHDIASVYVEKKALIVNTAEAWILAGDRYFYSVRFVQDPNELSAIYLAAINCYNKGLALNPNNIDAKINLAACYVDGTPDPMRGIGMLKEIEKTDSNNVSLQLTFALFSAKSQQWGKAIARYEKVIKLKPDHYQAYLYLADAYEKNGDIQNTIITLVKFIKVNPDKGMNREIRKYIEKLKNSNNNN